MSILDTVRRAKAYLQEQGRVSFRVLKREFELDDDVLDELIDELVDVQQVAAREGKVLSWVGAASTDTPAALTESQPVTVTIPEATAEPPSPSAVAAGERRQLTVMFCDLATRVRRTPKR